jgi:hypothetical protein
MLVFDTLEAAEALAADVRGNAEQQRSFRVIPAEVALAAVVAAAVA